MKFRNVTHGCALTPVLLLVCIAGCGPKQFSTAPVEGRVLYNGRPLDHGTVMLQPDVGPLAKGQIQADGSFRLSSYRENDGALVGKHCVTVICRDKPDKALGGEAAPGKLLIPERYINTATSGIEVTIKPSDNEPLLIELTGPAPK